MQHFNERFNRVIDFQVYNTGPWDPLTISTSDGSRPNLSLQPPDLENFPQKNPIFSVICPCRSK